MFRVVVSIATYQTNTPILWEQADAMVVLICVSHQYANRITNVRDIDPQGCSDIDAVISPAVNRII